MCLKGREEYATLQNVIKIYEKAMKAYPRFVSNL